MSIRCVVHAEADRAKEIRAGTAYSTYLTNGSNSIMRKILFAASVAALAIGAPLVAASSAMADTQPLITVGEGACVAPWYWEGPLNIAAGAEPYSACNGPAAPVKEGKLVGVLDGSCLLPWHWQGPGNILTNLLTGGQGNATYKA